MAELDINDLATIGVVKDQPAYMLPPEAWSLVRNARYVNGGVENIQGWSQVFGTPPVAPHHLLAYHGLTENYWIYASLAKIYQFNGSTHTDITRASGGDYNASSAEDWNSTILSGVPIFNNGVDIPQYWPDVAGNMANLLNWPSTMRARVIRSFGPYLVAIYITDDGDVFPHLVQWSHPADPGSVPVSWAFDDPAFDGGRTDLPDVSSGPLVDLLPLQNTMFLYKEGSTWRMDRIGGRLVMSFREFLVTTGLLAPRCVAIVDGLRHVVVTQDDIIVHNGNSAESILDKRMRRYLFNDMDTLNYRRSFIFTNSRNGEVWFCYPEQGSQQPNKALVWNYREGRMGAISEITGITFRHAAEGDLEGDPSGTWDDETTGSWAEATDGWTSFDRRRILLAGTAATKIYNLDSGLTQDGALAPSLLQREGLALIGRKRSGEWIVDHQNLKFIDRLWPKMQGGPVAFRIGVQQVVNGPVDWTSQVNFDPATQTFLGVTKSGRAVALEISTDGSVQWRLDGYKINVTRLGQH